MLQYTSKILEIERYLNDHTIQMRLPRWIQDILEI